MAAPPANHVAEPSPGLRCVRQPPYGWSGVDGSGLEDVSLSIASGGSRCRVTRERTKHQPSLAQRPSGAAVGAAHDDGEAIMESASGGNATKHTSARAVPMVMATT